MEILRVHPYNLVAKILVSNPDTEYEYTLTDMSDGSHTSGTLMSNSNREISLSLPDKYDTQYLVHVDEEENFFDVVRPYVDPNTKGSTASEISEYAKNEELARAIIDSVVIEGFYYQKKVIQTTGLGADYIPLWVDAKKLVKLYENNVLVYDSENPEMYEKAYGLSDDKTSIIEVYPDRINRYEGAPNYLPSAGSDLLDMKYIYKGFPRTFDYTLVVEHGYKKVPNDIVRAAELLVEDISCGKLDYYKRYISDYNTDQFKIKFDSRVFEGTGNIIVDKILSKYAKSIRHLGVL
jgi:hypothetical protein